MPYFSFTGACVFQENSPLRHRNVHRPCDRRSDHKLLPEDRYRAAAPGIPVRDTVKVTSDGIITGTPARSTLSAIQTPQVFQADLIKAALTNAMRKHLAITDDCSAVEQLRVKPVVTQGSEENIKITTPIDIELAELILRRRGKA